MKKLSTLLVLFLITTHFLYSQQKNEVSDSLNKYIHPVASHINGITDFTQTVEILKSKQFVSLGESSHGTKEFYEAKTEIIKGLIEKGNFRTIFIETDYASLIYLNQMLQGKEDTSLYKRFGQKGIYTIYKTQEVYQLFEYVRQYNSRHEKAEKVSIIGVDMQDLVMIARRVLYELPDSGKATPNVYKSLVALKDVFSTGQLVKFTKAEHERNLEAIALMKEKASAQNDVKFILLVRMIGQSYEMMNAKNDASRRNMRDKFMAENILWILSNFPDQGKSILWAHNAHISNIPSFTRTTLGSYLKPVLQNDLYSVAFMFQEGNVRILDPQQNGYQVRYVERSKNPKSIENVFADADSPAFFLDLEKLPVGKFLWDEIQKKTYMRSLGTTFFKDEKLTMGKEPLLDCFDGVIFFRKTNASIGF
jgi:erythromycin esterase